LEVSLSRAAALSALTVTVWVSLPSERGILRLAVWPTVRVIVEVAFWKPFCSTITVYSPGMSCVKV
jgi:hypothetical protein